MRIFGSLDRLLNLGSVPVHRDGVEWWRAPVPRRWHRCRVQSAGMVGHTLFERCPCGGIRLHGTGPWLNRNQRLSRKGAHHAH